MDSVKINVLRSTICPKHKKSINLEFDKLGRDLTISKGKFRCFGQPIDSKNLIPGFGLRIQNMKSNFTAHIIPALENLQELPDRIAAIIDKLRNMQTKSYDETIGFITGGKCLKPTSRNYDASMKVMDSLYEIMAEEKKVPTTVIAEHLNPTSTISMYSNRNNITIYDDVKSGVLSQIETTQEPSREEIEDILMGHFNFVEISPKVPVEIVDKLV